jgi:hypothetical protein
MARSRYRFLQDDTVPYFITATTVNWLPLFSNPDIARILLDSLRPERIFNAEMMAQKIDYIHRSPVKRGYVDKPEQWCYSSARNYAGIPGLLPVEQAW